MNFVFSVYNMNDILTNLKFREPCIVIYSYNKTNEMHNFSNLFLE